MNFKSINVSTGPVQISPEVLTALSSAPISHRSKEFKHLYLNTTNFLCNQFNVTKCYLLTGSGTAANEAMLWQIKMHGGIGLILSNGEFGERLISQASRTNLEFVDIRLTWGKEYNIIEIEKTIIQNKIRWLLFCHCETSTGVMNDMNGLVEVCIRNNCLCFIDCMSTVGTYSFDLSKVAMATASSGKGFASFPGLAIILSNIETVSSNAIPVYFDLGIYDEKAGIPYTISSNLVSALYVAVKLKFQNEQLKLIDFYANQCFSILKQANVLPFNNNFSKVFTVSLPGILDTTVINKLRNEQLIFSCKSEYLIKRGWLQLALFGYFKESDLIYFLSALERSFLISSENSETKAVSFQL